jgi:hypothetical protein
VRETGIPEKAEHRVIGDAERLERLCDVVDMMGVGMLGKRQLLVSFAYSVLYNDPEPRACKWVQGDPSGPSPVRLCPLEARDPTGDAPRNGLEPRRVGGIGGSDTYVSARMLDKGAKRVADRVHSVRFAPGFVFLQGR